MRGIYTSNITISSLSTAKTLMLVKSPTTAVLEIYSVIVNNLDSETSEQWNISLCRTSTYGSPAGTSITPEKSESLDSSSSVTALGDLTVEPTAYSSTVLDKQGVNNLSGYRFDPIPELRPIIAPGVAIGVRMLSAPSSFNATISITYREIG